MLNVWSMIWTSFLNPASAKCVIFETRRYSSSVDRENTCHILLLYLYLYPTLLYFPIDPVIPWCNRGTCILMWNLYSLEKNFFDNLTTVKAINPTLIGKVTFWITVKLRPTNVKPFFNTAKIWKHAGILRKKVLWLTLSMLWQCLNEVMRNITVRVTHVWMIGCHDFDRFINSEESTWSSQ